MRRALVLTALLASTAPVVMLAVSRGTPTPSPETAAPQVLPVSKGVAALAMSLGCPPDRDAFECLDAQALDVYENEGAAGLVGTVASWQQQSLPDGLPCHRLTHVVGKNAAERLDLEDAVSDSIATTGLCSNGFFHGIIEGTAYRFAGEALASRLSRLCAAVDESQYNDCIHSSGHAMAMTEPGDVFAALELCGSFAPDDARCAAGVFMSYGRGTAGFEADGSPRWISYAPGVPARLCADMSEGYAPHCWFLLWTAYENDPALGGVSAYREVCPDPESVPVEQQPDSFRFCYRGLGMLLLEKGALDAHVAAERCPPAAAGYWCTFGIGWAFMYDQVLAFGTSEGFESVCGSFSPERIQACRAGEKYALVDGDNL